MSELPEGWSETTVGEVSKHISYGFTTSASSVRNGPKFLRITDIQNGKVDWDNVPFCETPPSDTSRYILRPGDIVFARTGATTGKSFLINSTPDAVFASYLIRVRPADCVLPDLMAYFFQTDSYWQQITDNLSGSAQPNCNATKLSSLRIPIPPLNEQRRIVVKLEKLLSRVNVAQERLAAIPSILRRFRQSVLAAACSGRLTVDWREENPNSGDASSLIAKLEKAHQVAGGHKRGNAAPPTDEVHDLTLAELPSTWRMTDLRTAVCPDRPITYGILKPGPETPGGILYVRVADFPNDILNLSTIRRTTKEIESVFARARLREGDILLSIRGTVGRVCVAPSELNNANITQDTARLSIQPALDSSFVMWFLRAHSTQKRMQRAVKGVAVRGINIGDVRALQLPVPPLAEQQEIIRRIEALFKTADALEARYEKAKTYVGKLTQSILAKAFRGELVPQDPNDEPASVLLERIGQKGLTQKKAGKKVTRNDVR